MGCPLLLGKDVEESAKKVILSTRESGCAINNSIVIRILTGIVRNVGSNLLAEHGGPIHVDKSVT